VTSLRRTVVISEPHPYRTAGKLGGHHYADLFARHGWRVLLFSATFNRWRLLLPSPGIAQESIDLWRSGGSLVAPEIVNVTLTHLLPERIRNVAGWSGISSRLYSPSPGKLLRRWLGSDRVNLLWLNGNGDGLLRQAIPHDKMLVRIIDNYEGFSAGYSNFHPMMRKTLEAADGVFACSHFVRDLYGGFRRDIEVVPNGVDLDRFSEAGLMEPELLKGIPHPRAVYVGAVAAWFDWDLMLALAKRMPAVHVLVIGPWLRAEPSPAGIPENLHLLGPVPYALVPAVLSHCSVGLVPFLLNDLVKGVSPIKVYEYLAAGIPVVSLRWPELEIEKLPITLASSLDEFVEGVGQALSCSESGRRELKEFAKECSWEKRLRKLLKQVEVDLDEE